MASAAAVSRYMGREFTRSRKESEEGFSVYGGGADYPGEVYVHYTCGDELNRTLDGEQQRQRIAEINGKYTEHLADRWKVQRHPKLHNVLILTDKG
ncbi:hypothetical protein ACKI1K_18455 [Streptomyces scabiei]|uniref:hypothetical protein n=1 Tax=Streptomyces scabiei TaxID=1930 RepID=UPI0038F6CBA7